MDNLEEIMMEDLEVIMMVNHQRELKALEEKLTAISKRRKKTNCRSAVKLSLRRRKT